MAMSTKFDTSLVTNESERWFADTYALWSACAGGNWQLIGGYPKNKETAAMLQKILERDWGITNLTEGMKEVNLLVAEEYHKDSTVDAWDFCRGMQLLGIFYVVGYLDRDQMMRDSCTVGKIMQSHFHSWEELCKSYLAGYEKWCKRTFNSVEAEQRVAERRAQYEKFRRMKDGPYHIAWKLDLSLASNEKPTEDSFQQWLKQEEK